MRQAEGRYRLRACAALNLLVMGYTVRHIMYEPVRPFDWVMLFVEVLVLAFVGYGEIVSYARNKKADKRQQEADEHQQAVANRQQELDSRIRKTNEFVSRGQMLQKTAPVDGDPSVDRIASLLTRARDWRGDVASWIMDTNGFLQACSPQASAKFLDDSQASYFRENNRYGTETLASYEEVDRRLHNLQDIMQNPSVYL
jgi:C4-dicarboxylate-specific signal transduction histidine kinase